jgi:hypothetical protein
LLKTRQICKKNCQYFSVFCTDWALDKALTTIYCVCSWKWKCTSKIKIFFLCHADLLHIHTPTHTQTDTNKHSLFIPLSFTHTHTHIHTHTHARTYLDVLNSSQAMTIAFWVTSSWSQHLTLSEEKKENNNYIMSSITSVFQ